jgi:phosphoribosylaminoimidazole carboxylase
MLLPCSLRAQRHKRPSSPTPVILQRFGLPLVLKAKRLAYDGRGNVVVRSMGDVDAAFAALRASGEVYAERWVPFVRELAVVVARGQPDEAVAAYPVVHTVQREGQCHVVHAPAPVSAAVQEAATRCALAAVGVVRGRGVFAVELFELPDGSVLFNEMAPRVHNSGHLTAEACHTSQFEQHVRCVAGLPLGSPALRVPHACMLNVVGAAEEGRVWRLLGKALATPACSLHWYGKACRPARKLGHVTVTGPSAVEVQGTLTQLLAAEAGPGEAAAGGTAAGAVAPAPSSFSSPAPLVGIIMGSDSDLPPMSAAAQVLRNFGVPFELTVVSAHRTPQRLVDYARGAHGRGLKVIIAGAGGAAHLPGMAASMTPLPVVGVPIPLTHLDGVDSLHSIVQMPRGIPVATVAIGNATNAGLLAVRMLATSLPRLQEAMLAYQARLEAEVTVKAQRLEALGWEAYAAEMAAATAAGKRSDAAAAPAASTAGR